MDGVVLALDASTYDGSVAVLYNGQLVADRTVAMRGEQEERLMPGVADALRSAGVGPHDIRGVICGAGPGSFTSLRIAGAIAKGMAMATGAPLYGVSSLALAAVQAGAGRWLVTLDAMRGDVYSAAYEWTGAELTELLATAICSRDAAAARAQSVGAEVVSGRPHARAAEGLLPGILHAGPADLAAWEPNYGRLAEAQVRWETAHGQPLSR